MTLDELFARLAKLRDRYDGDTVVCVADTIPGDNGYIGDNRHIVDVVSVYEDDDRRTILIKRTKKRPTKRRKS